MIAIIEPDVFNVGDALMVRSEYGARTLNDAVRAFLESEDGQPFALADAPRYGNAVPRCDGSESFSQRVRRLR